MRYAVVLILVTLIVIAHIFLWRSEMETGAKLTFTLINTAGWTIILAPILLVDRWLAAIKSRNSETVSDKDVT
ncbi:MAG: phenylalanyl-tRNA synthetase subunit beta [Pseudomonadota bacterium]